MKRIVEIVFTVIGLVIYGLTAVLSLVFLNVQDNPGWRADMQSILNQDQNMEQAQISVDQIMEGVASVTWIIIISALVAVILGIVAVVFLKGNKKPKPAGIILIITGIVTTIGTIGFGLFGGLAFLIAGIIALVRKSENPIDDESSFASE
ncbi:DUF4064 domain-containing protein [Halobacillus amylolyticus]|uniref:DUF4064 domain-containing protein n=1 Tax=Halobacillus amylolyticus TaxID=2932259 RepID=A0ABY4H6R4_9BACI|nr:DUF4064 domain-containing protein [Halobacillus amylolyticus]UOR10462.1 DUF4064 domain-containing protein [Halobacillus amylolyticus]